MKSIFELGQCGLPLLGLLCQLTYRIVDGLRDWVKGIAAVVEHHKKQGHGANE